MFDRSSNEDENETHKTPYGEYEGSEDACHPAGVDHVENSSRD